MKKFPLPKKFEPIYEAVSNNDTKQIEILLKKYGLSNSQFKAVEIKYQGEYTFFLFFLSVAAHDGKLDKKTAEIVFDYATSAIEARKFLKVIDQTLRLEPSEQSETAPGEIIESLHDVNSRKDIQKRIEKLSQGELKSLVSHIVSKPDLKVSYELMRSIMRAILYNNSINYETLIFPIIPLSRTTAYTS